MAEYTGASVLTATYAYGPGIDEPLKAQRGATLAAYHTDGLGSVLLVSQADGASATLASYAYDAFGEDLGSSGGFENPYTFTGRERDASGLVYYRARYYLPRTGRFVSPDPLGLAGGATPYAYAGSNPVNFTDPLGLTPLYAKAGFGNATSPVHFPAFSTMSRAAPTGGGTSIAAQAAGFGLGAASGALFSYGVAACASAFAACGPAVAVVGTGALAYDAFHGFSGTRAFLGSLHSIATGNATFEQAVSAGFGLGGLAGGFASTRVAASTAPARNNTLAQLESAASRATELIGQGRGPVYGTRVHAAFEAQVQSLGRSDLATEVSYLGGRIVPRGMAGSVRLDVVEGPLTSPLSVYDLKTGGAILTPARILQIQSQIPGGYKVPVVEVRAIP